MIGGPSTVVARYPSPSVSCGPVAARDDQGE